MSNIHQLIQFINCRRSYDEVKAKAYEIDQFWREQSWTRALRELSEDKIGKSAIIRPVRKENKPNSPVIGYEPKNAPTANFEPKKGIQALKQDLNSQLIEVLKKIPVSWDNQKHIKSINLAIHSNSEYLKKAVLQQYK